MKTIHKLMTQLLLVTISLLSIQISSYAATTLANDQFTTGVDGYAGIGLSYDSANGGRLNIYRDTTASKTYNFGTGYANTTLFVIIRFYVNKSWETSGSSADYFNVLENGTIIQSYQGDGDSYVKAFTVTTDATGKVTLGFNPDSTSNKENAYVDYVKITDEVTSADLVTAVYTNGKTRPFELINPPQTRNVIGNYAIAGNTVLCLTDKKSGYGGTCHGDSDYQTITSNKRVAKYLDIDSDNSTWNSTSSYIDFSTTEYDPQRGILWAGLFWQGRISWDKDYKIHYAVENGSGFSYVETGSGSNTNSVDVASVGATQIKLQIDNGNYNDVPASTFHTYQSGNGQTYAAFADVTSILQSASLTKDKHVFTVANLTTMEGREPSPGAFGGWSLVVIYAEDYATGDPHNISIYNGFTTISRSKPINITGFKLPKSGQVNAQLSVFSGEGEYRYGYRPGYHDNFDWMKISNQQDTGYVYLPGCTSGDGLGNCNNMFDAQLVGINRDHVPGEYNDLGVNNVGIDVDNYDVSDIMTNYRTQDPDIDTVYIKTYSNVDYVTMSMLAFSAELYRPSLCYDYVVRMPDQKAFTKAPKWDPEHQRFGHYIYGQNHENTQLLAKVYIRSLEGDLQLQDVYVGIRDLNGTRAHFDYGQISENGSYAYVNVQPKTTSPDAFLPFGNGADPYGNGQRGGTIDANQSFYAKFYYDATGEGGSFDDYINIEAITHLDFGSGPVESRLSTEYGTLTRCDTNPTYDALPGRFNIERSDAIHDSDHALERYPLYTQIVGKPFDVSIVALNADDLTDPTPPLLEVTDIGVELELFDAGFFDNNSTAGFDSLCEDYDKDQIIINRFVAFPETTPTAVVDVPQVTSNTALKNAAFRIWYIADTNGTIQFSRDCYTNTWPNDTCFANEYHANNNEIQERLDPSGICNSQCSGSNSGCYECLKNNFGHPVCSRDNFSIRPAALQVKVFDDNTTGIVANRTLIVSNSDGNKNTQEFHLAAGYSYPIEIEALDYTASARALKYTVTFDFDSTQKVTQKLKFIDSASCADTADKSLNENLPNNRFELSGGISKHDLNLTAANVGKYKLMLLDTSWTIVDQSDYENITKFDGQVHADCLKNGTDDNRTDEVLFGCFTSSKVPGNASRPETTNLQLTFHPYSFDLTSITMSNTPDSTNAQWVYMDDLSKYTSASTRVGSMAVVLDGNITALGADGNDLSNFVNGCAADDIQLWLDYNTSYPYKGNIQTEDGTHVPFQQWLDAQADTTAQPVEDDTGDMNATLTRGNFIINTDRNGTAPVALYYNFAKSYTEMINPVNVLFDTLHGYTPSRQIYADKRSDYIAQGDINVDGNRTFYFAKVAPKLGDEYITTYDSNYTTFLRVNIFCREDGIDITDCNSLIGLGAQEEPVTAGGGWYRSASHDTVAEGIVQSLSADHSGINELPRYNISFDSNGSTADLTLTYPAGNPRPGDFNLIITPDPWLKYNPNDPLSGNPDFSIHYLIEGLRWKGSGKTGHVISTQPFSDENKRVNW